MISIEIVYFPVSDKRMQQESNGTASQAEFNNPEGCQFGPDGALYIADHSNHLIRKIEERAGE